TTYYLGAYKINKDGSGFTLLQTGPGGSRSSLLLGSDGALYGTCIRGGSNGLGSVFTLAPNGSNYAVLHHFSTNGFDGQQPYAGLVEGIDGALYGVTSAGGTNVSGFYGTIFRLNKDGSGYSVLWRFGSPQDSAYFPVATLLKANDGTFYGSAAGS